MSAQNGSTERAPGVERARLRVRHVLAATYTGPVTSSYNEVRMTPMAAPGQLLLESRLDMTPRAAAYRYVDYFGAQVVAFDVQAPHERMEIVSTNVVEIEPAAPRVDDVPGWGELSSHAARDRNVEWLADGLLTRPAPEVAEFARAAAREGSPVEAARDICAGVRDRMALTTDSPRARRAAEQAWEAGSGGCEDLAHVALGALRSVGLPARFVMGYMHPDPQAAMGEAVEGHVHAWVEWWAGRWEAWDVVHGQPVTADHVIVGRARDLDDVPPLRGVFAGAEESRVDVSVQVTRLR